MILRSILYLNMCLADNRESSEKMHDQRGVDNFPDVCK